MLRTKELFNIIRVQEIESKDPDFFTPIEYLIIYGSNRTNQKNAIEQKQSN